MKNNLSWFITLVIFAALAFSSNIFAQDSTRTQLKPKYKKQIKWQKGEQVKAKKGNKFVDENKDGINDNAPDHDGDGVNDNALDDDGDGIPNGQDPDYVRPEDGSGKKKRNIIKTKNEIGKDEAPKSPANTNLKK